MEEIDLQVAQNVVLLYRQYKLIENLVQNQSFVLKDFELAIENGEQSFAHVLDVYNYVFALIDHLERYRKISLTIPKLNKKSPEYRHLIASMGDLKDVRNQIQHIERDIKNSYSGHLLGSISWASGAKQFNAGFPDIGRERSAPGLIFHTHKGTHIHQFVYIYNDKYHDLQKAIDGAKVFNEYISSVVQIQENNKDYKISENFFAYCVDFNAVKSNTASLNINPDKP